MAGFTFSHLDRAQVILQVLWTRTLEGYELWVRIDSNDFPGQYTQAGSTPLRRWRIKHKAGSRSSISTYQYLFYHSGYLAVLAGGTLMM